MIRKSLVNVAALLSLTIASQAFAAPQVEVLHFWTSGSEAAGLNELKTELSKQGVSWKDSPVAGGTGGNMVQVLHSRIASGDAPAAVQMHANQISVWGAEKQLRDLDDIARKGNWDAVIAPELIPSLKVDGHWVAAPVDVHRSNWLWYNKKVFDKNGLTPPKTWDEFNKVAEKLQAAGVTPLALGGQPWQELDLFESLVLGIGGPDFYTKAIVKQDETALRSPTMIKVFDELKVLRKYVDRGYPGREWNLATTMVIQGKAGMQIMGDWAKGEMTLANQKANVDYGCAPAPGTDGSYLWLIDAFAFFKSTNADVQAGQAAMAAGAVDKNFQEAFSLKKGSIPARLDVSPARFDECGKEALADRAQAAASHKSVPSLAHNAATSEEKTGVFLDTISSFFEGSTLTSKDAVDRLVTGLKSVGN